MEMIMLLIKK